ncbi:hypothetical protein OAG63_00355 [Methylacidiphilales bacterium]|nr:hypothetical protein [Candidatus Methylacidiphilales bacterium]
MKTNSKKSSLRLGKFIANAYDIYFPRDHGHYGTDADHVPVIPGNDFAPDDTASACLSGSRLRKIARE